jgi:peroxiredoxin
MNEIKKKWFQILTLLVILSLSIEVVWLSVQNRRMKLMLSSLTPAHQVEPLKAGERVGPVRLQLIGGGTTELKYDEPKNKHLLFIFSTTCPHCEKTMPAWDTIAQKTSSNNCSIIGISVDSIRQTTEYVLKKKLAFYVSSVSDSGFIKNYKIPGWPETILVESGGIVQKTWVGELSPEQIAEINTLLGVLKAPIN